METIYKVSESKPISINFIYLYFYVLINAGTFLLYENKLPYIYFSYLMETKKNK